MIETSNVGKCYRRYRNPFHRVYEFCGWGGERHEKFWALKNVYLDVNRGSSFGIIGPNGAGKSTLLKLFSGITQPTEGHLRVDGSVASILELGTGFHPEFSGRSNVYLNCALQGYTREETDRLLPRIIAFSELEDFIDQPVRTYSTGMYLRLAFAVATTVDPDVLIVDEALAVGDERFRNKCLDKMNEFKAAGKTILFVSHDLATVRHFCSHVALLDKGRILARGAPDEVLDQYLEMTHRDQIQKSSAPGSESDAPRWGSGEIEIERILMKDGQGRGGALFDTHSSVTIEAEFRVQAPVRGVVFGYQFFRSDGAYVHGSNHFWHKEPAAHDFLKSGERGIARCVIPDLPLLPGQYYLTHCCYNNFDGFPKAIDHWERVINFTISQRLTDQHGIFAMDTDWSLERIETD